MQCVESRQEKELRKKIFAGKGASQFLCSSMSMACKSTFHYSDCQWGNYIYMYFKSLKTKLIISPKIYGTYIILITCHIVYIVDDEFKFLEDGRVHYLPWTEFLSLEKLAVESRCELIRWAQTLAPWIGDEDSSIQYACGSCYQQVSVCWYDY